MISKIKKPVSILLSILMVVSLFTIVPITASAAVGDFVPEKDYLTFTAEEDNSWVMLNYQKILYGDTFKYNKNNSGWEDYTNKTQIDLKKGDSVRFRAKAPMYGQMFGQNNHFSIGGKVACSGNVMSLRLDDNGMSQGLSIGCFNYLFYNCTGLTAAPELPETTLATECYSNMFNRCTSLTTAPALPATTLAGSCYMNMFSASGLTTAPALPATKLAYACYSAMFSSCTSLTALPALPATTLSSSCYSYMFAGCSKIKLSETQTADSIPYSVPSGGNGTGSSSALEGMFLETGGTFKGTPEINKTYYVVPTYTVTWKNGETVLKTDRVEKGTAPAYTGNTPEQAEDENYTYTFSGWTDSNNTFYAKGTALPEVTGDQTYTATFTATPKGPTPKIYTKDSEGIADGVILENPGDAIDTTGTSQCLLFYSDVECDYFNDGYDVWDAEFREDWSKVSAFFINDNNEFICYNCGYYSKFTPHDGKVFKVSYNSSANVWIIAEVDPNDQEPLAPVVYTMYSDGIADGVILKNTNDMISAMNTSGTLVFDCDVHCDYNNDGTNVSDVESGDVWWGVSAFFINDNNEFICYNDGDYSKFTPHDGMEFKVSFNSSDEKWHITEVPAPEAPTAKLIAGHTLSIEGNIAINFYLDPSAAGLTADQVTADNFSYSLEWVDKANTKAKVDVAKQAAGQAFSKEGSYIKVTCHVCAAEMSCDINASFTMGEKTESETYSIRKYGDSVYNATTEQINSIFGGQTEYNNLVGLMNKMLDYGSNAQTVFGVKTYDLADSGLGLETQEVTSDMFTEAIQTANGRQADDISAKAAELGASFKSPSLVFLDYSTIKLYFAKENDSFNTAGLTKWNDYYYAQVRDIPAAKLDTLQEFEVSGTKLYYSALDYAKALAGTSNTDYVKLAWALYGYNQAANAYFDAAPAQNIVNLSTVTEDTTVEDGYTITGTLGGNFKISIADGAKVTLQDVNITKLGTGCNWAGINCPGDATLVLEGENTVCAGLGGDGNNHYPGIWIAPDKTLTIEGDGSLTAYSGNAPYGAGIGGGYKIAAGNIVINGGIITATGGNLAAGIGSGPNDSCGDITINGGTVTATCTGQRAAGIGSGSQGNCGNITINGGTVTASGSKWGAGIGSGASKSSCGNITISAKVTSVTATKGSGAPNSIGAGAYNSTCGTVTIEDGANVTQN